MKLVIVSVLLFLFFISCASMGIGRNLQYDFIEAARNGKIEVVRDLFPKVDIDTDLGRGTALMAAAFNEHYSMVVFLVENGADLFLRTSNGMNALGFAEMGGDIPPRPDKPKIVAYLKEKMAEQKGKK